MNGDPVNSTVANGGLQRPRPHPIHYVVIAVMALTVFMLDVWTPLGIADWLLYVIPIGYAVRYVRRGRITFSTVSWVAAGLTVLMLVGWFLSPPGLSQEMAFVNRILGILALWFVAMFVAWLSNRIHALRETEAIIRRQLDENEQRLAQAWDAGGMAAVEWDLRKGTVQWRGSHVSLTGHGVGPWTESYGEYLERVHQEDRDKVREEIYSAMRERSDYNVQCRIHGQDGEPRSVALRGRFVYRGVQPVRMVGVCFDLADRRSSTVEQAEQVVIELEELTKIAAAQGAPWRKTREWAQRVTRMGMQGVWIFPRGRGGAQSS